MIFVTLGTQDKAFDRLINEVSKIKGHEVIVQSGYTKCPDTLSHADYYDNDTFIKYIKDADFIITHGGVGSIIQALRYQKKILAVARLSKYKEHTNDHQIQIVKKFEKEGYLISFNEGDDINMKLKELENFKPKTFVSNRDVFIEKLYNYIESI